MQSGADVKLIFGASEGSIAQISNDIQAMLADIDKQSSFRIKIGADLSEAKAAVEALKNELQNLAPQSSGTEILGANLDQVAVSAKQATAAISQAANASIEAANKKKVDAEAARQQSDAYNQSKTIIARYYDLLTEVAATKNDIISVNGVYTTTTEGSQWLALADALNNATEKYRQLDDIKKTLSDDQRADLVQRETRAMENYTVALGKAANATVMASQKEQDREVTRQQGLAYEQAANTIKAYADAMKELITTKNDIYQVDGVYQSESGMWDGLATRLNSASQGYIELKANLDSLQISEEQQIELSNRMAATEANLGATSEKAAAKAADAQATRDQTAAYQEAVNIISDYYRVMTQLVTTKNDISLNNGVYASASGVWEPLAASLNRATGEYERLSTVVSSLPLDKQTKLTRAETLAKEKLSVATAKAAEAEATARNKANDSVAVTKRYGQAIGNIESALKNYTAARNSSSKSSREAYATLQREADELHTLRDRVSQTGQGYDELDARVKQANTTFITCKNTIRAAGDDTKSFGDRIGKVASQLTVWFSTYRVIMMVYRAIRNMVSASVELDKSLTQMQVVTRESDAVMGKFADTAAEAAHRIGSSITDFVDSATTFARLGYNLDEAATLSEYTAMLQNVGDIDVNDAQDAITAIVKAYADIDVDNIEQVMDKLVTVGNNFPISVSQIAEGMNNASSTLAAAGNSFEESVALLAAANTTMQNAAKASTGLRTITARLRNTTVDLEELGEDMTTAKYEEIVQTLTDFGVALTDVNGDYRSTYEIMSDIAAKWNELTSMEQAALATALAGTRQQAVFYSIINNFKEATGAMEAMTGSAGALKNAYDIYMQSAKAHIDQFKTKFQELSKNLIEAGFIKSIVDFGSKLLGILNAIAKLIDSLGGLNTVLMATLNILAIMKADAIVTFITRIGRKLKSLGETVYLLGLEFVSSFQSARAAGSSGLRAIAAGFKGVAASASAAQIAVGAFVALISVAVLVSNAMRDAENASREAQNAAYDSAMANVQESETIYELYGAYLDAKKAADENIGSKEALDKATRALAEALGLEAQAAAEANEELKELSANELEKAYYDAQAAVVAAEQAINDTVKEKFDSEYGDVPVARYAFDAGNRLGITGRDDLSDAEKATDLLEYYNRCIEERNRLIDEGKTDTEDYKFIVGDIKYWQDYVDRLIAAREAQAAALERYNAVLNDTATAEEAAASSGEGGADGAGGAGDAPGEVNDLSDALTKLKSAYDIVTKAEKDMADGGGLSAETIAALKKETDNYTDYLYEENGAIKLNIAAWEQYANKEMADDIQGIQNTISKLEEQKGVLKRIIELAEQYNSLTNGNVDYRKRPVITPEAMAQSGWDIGDAGDYATVFTQGFTERDFDIDYLGKSDKFKYAIDVTPILEDGTVLTPESLNDYVQSLIEQYGEEGSDAILKHDVKKLIVNIDEGEFDYSNLKLRQDDDPRYNIDLDPFESLQTQLEPIKQEHLELVESAGLVSDALGTKLPEAVDKNASALADSQKQLSIYMALLNELTTSAKKAGTAIAKSIDNINGSLSGLSALDKIYADVLNGDNFDFSSLLSDDFVKAFGECEGAYEEFIDTVANSSGDLAACQDAFDNLATAYLRNSGALEGLTTETRDVTVAMLEQMGIANAAQIVDYQLALQKERAKYATEEYANMTYEEIMALYNEAEAGSLTKQVLAELALEKALINAEGINTASDVDNIISLANAANATTQTLKNLAAAKELFAKADAASNSAKAFNRLILDAENDRDAITLEKRAQRKLDQAEEYRKQAEKLLNQQPEYNLIDSGQFKAQYSGGSTSRGVSAKSGSGGSGGSGTSGSSSAEKVKTWFEEQYAYHQHLVAMEQETDAAYYKWLESAYKKAYSEGIIELDDYRKYQEEVYKGLQDVFKDYLSDVEHEIDMRSKFTGENKKIVSLYKKLIKDVENEIAAARKRGLTDNDDYIQTLQKQWSGYRDEIKEIEDDLKDNAKDAVKELIDIRIDMLKQDIDDQKDAIKEKLDALKEFYDKQKEMLQDVYDEEKYLEEQAEKRKSVADIQAQIAQLEYDNSAWAQKRKLELAEELNDAQKELKDFEKDHALEVAQEELDKLYEMQEKELDAQTEALENQEKNAKELYDQALKDIKNGSIALYNEMIEWNNVYGDGIADTITSAWEEAYIALKEYKEYYGKGFDGINLANATGYTAPKETYSNAAVVKKTTTSSSSSSKSTSSSSSKKSSTSSAPALTKGSTVTVKTTATNFSAKSGNVRMASFVPGGKYTVYDISGNEVLIGLNGVYTGWINKSDIVGYAKGTKRATAGIHKIDELGSETIFESSDGNKYKLFTGGEKVLSAKASSFLYDFATGGTEVLSRLIKEALSGNSLGNINPIIINNDIRTGDIVIQGNANKATVSDIRRAQRDSLETMLKELNRLNKKAYSH